MIPINKPWLDDDAKQEVMNVLDENALTSPAKNGGKRVQAFENLLKSYLKVKHVIAVNSGTSAIHASLLSLGVKPGDEVTSSILYFCSYGQFSYCYWSKACFCRYKQK